MANNAPTLLPTRSGSQRPRVHELVFALPAALRTCDCLLYVNDTTRRERERGRPKFPVWNHHVTDGRNAPSSTSKRHHRPAAQVVCSYAINFILCDRTSVFSCDCAHLRLCSPCCSLPQSCRLFLADLHLVQGLTRLQSPPRVQLGIHLLNTGGPRKKFPRPRPPFSSVAPTIKNKIFLSGKSPEELERSETRDRSPTFDDIPRMKKSRITSGSWQQDDRANPRLVNNHNSFTHTHTHSQRQEVV